MKIGIISGNKIENLIDSLEKIDVETPFGDVLIEVAKCNKHSIYFINRHGEKSNIPPHKVNYLGNIHAFSSSHVDCILAMGTVGSMKKNILPGDFVVPHDFIDFTHLRNQTYYNEKRIHVDMTNPYCPFLRNLLIENIRRSKGLILHEKGVYLTTEGPRLETASEINLFSKFADIVGMTGSPEVVLAREKGICYASLCLVCNMAAGLQKKLETDEISSIYSDKKLDISEIIKKTIDSIDKKGDCICRKDITKASL